MKVVGCEFEAKPSDHCSFAFRAVGVICVVRCDIEEVDELQPDIQCDFAALFQSLDGCSRQVAEFVFGHEPTKVQGDLRAQVAPNPQAHIPNLLHVVVEGRDN